MLDTTIPAGSDDVDAAPLPGPTQLVARHTIETIVSLRDQALERYLEAHARLIGASDAIRAAKAARREAAPLRNSFNKHLYPETERKNRHEHETLLYELRVVDGKTFEAKARRLLDADVWAHIIEIGGFEHLMDHRAKEDLRRQLQDDPPPITVDNVTATLEKLLGEAHTIFARGIATCFSALDRRFRSHLGFRFGARIILTNVFDTDTGRFDAWSKSVEHLMDVERAFHVLDGQRPPDRYEPGGAVAAIDATDGYGGPRRRTVKTEYLEVRGFKNGNAHVWPLRRDLIDQVNRVLAEYYGEVLDDDTEARRANARGKPKTSAAGMAKYYGHYPTPQEVADRLLHVGCLHPGLQGKLRVLEPSAGEGNLAKAMAAMGHEVDCVEVQPALAATLEASGIYRRVRCADFLSLVPDPVYDRVIMNPPFDGERDIEHVRHALGFLKDDGLLAAIVSAGTEYRETARARTFRNDMTARNAQWADLPQGSFRTVGTNVNTMIVTVWGDGRRHQHGW